MGELTKHDRERRALVDRMNYVVVIRRLPKYVSWLLLSLVASAFYLVLASTGSLTEPRGTVLVMVADAGVLVFLSLSMRELRRMRADSVRLPGR
jgi:energy-converting hydrogenase Eha subunit C